MKKFLKGIPQHIRVIWKKNRFLEVDFENLPADPGERKHISCYLQKGPCKPRDHDFPKWQFGTLFRKFNPDWFLEFRNMLKYNVSKDVAFCLYCYLMRLDIGEQKKCLCIFGRRFFELEKKG